MSDKVEHVMINCSENTSNLNIKQESLLSILESPIKISYLSPDPLIDGDSSTNQTNFTCNSDDIDDFEAILFDFKNSEQYTNKYKVVKINFGETKTSSKFRKHTKFSHLSSYIAKCLDCERLFSCSSTTYYNLKRHKEHCFTARELTNDTSSEIAQISPVDLAFNDRILNFILESGISFESTQCQTFQALFNKETVPSIEIIKNCLKMRYDAYLEQLKYELNRIDTMTLCIDCWTSYERTYLSIIAAYFDPNSEIFSKKHKMLSCKRLEGSITFEAIEKCIIEVISDFDLDLKVTRIVFDNYSCHFNNEILNYSTSNTTNIKSNSIEQLLANSFYQPSIELPLRMPCVVHNLNLIATIDAFDENTPEFTINYDSVITNLKSLWNFPNKFPQFPKTFKTIFGVELKLPDVKWTSLYDSIEFVYKLIEDGKMLIISDTMSEFDETANFNLTSENIKFMEEYLQVLEPLKVCINYFQSENVCYGELLFGIQCKLLSTLKSLMKLKYCKKLRNNVINGVNKRFKIFYDDELAVIAALLHPSFKKKVTVSNLSLTDQVLEKANQRIIEELQMLNPSNDQQLFYQSEKRRKIDESTSRVHNFFPFLEKEHESHIQQKSPQIILLNNYYDDARYDFNILYDPQFENIRKLFEKFNVQTTSSEKSEKLISMGNEILMMNNLSIEDDCLERILFMKIN